MRRGNENNFQRLNAALNRYLFCLWGQLEWVLGIKGKTQDKTEESS